MTRVKRGIVARKRRKQILKFTKGFRGSSSNLYKVAHQRIIKALVSSYRDRKKRKRYFIELWISRINAAVRNSGLNYSNFINKLKLSNISLNRKICGQLALKDKNSFDKLLEIIQTNN
uniref:ribosomal protein L20 n=1 Tax=Prototheca fontanea TaxID=2836215 RepID=UPI00300127A3